MVPISTLLQKLQLIKRMIFDRKKLGDRGLGDRLGWVVRITPYAQFCPIPSPFLLIFSKNGFEVKLNTENWQKHPKLLM